MFTVWLAYIIIGILLTFGALYLKAKNDNYVEGKDVFIGLIIFGILWPLTVPMFILYALGVLLTDGIASSINNLANK